MINSIKLEFCTSFPQNWKDGAHLEAGKIKGVITEEFLLELGLKRREESVENSEGTEGKNIDMKDNKYYVQRMADVLFCWSVGFMGGSDKRWWW